MGRLAPISEKVTTIGFGVVWLTTGIDNWSGWCCNSINSDESGTGLILSDETLSTIEPIGKEKFVSKLETEFGSGDAALNDGDEHSSTPSPGLTSCHTLKYIKNSFSFPHLITHIKFSSFYITFTFQGSDNLQS